MMTLVVVLVVSSALLVGAAWGLYGRLSKGLEGFLVAMAGGALIVSVMTELIEPATETAPLWAAMTGVAAGAVVFTLVDRWVAKRFGAESGGGLLVAITLDGVPENLALGVALIGTGALEVAALAGSIFLSNLPEAAGGARDMAESGTGRGAAFGLWLAVTLLLSAAALIGNYALSGASETTLAVIRCFAAGAVTASLATEVFPKGFREDHHLAGIAVTVGLVFAVLLQALAEA